MNHHASVETVNWEDALGEGALVMLETHAGKPALIISTAEKQLIRCVLTTAAVQQILNAYFGIVNTK